MEFDFGVPELDESMDILGPIEADELPEQSAEERHSKIGPGIENYPELQQLVPVSAGRTFGCCRYYGFPSNKAFETFVSSSRIPDDMCKFDDLRARWCDKFGIDKVKMDRPELKNIEITLASLRQSNPAKLQQTIGTLLDSPPGSIKELYAIGLNNFLQLWFTADGAPFDRRGMNPSVHFDRVNTLVKVLDRSANGFRPINAKRTKLVHEKKADRMIETKKQTRVPRAPLEQPTAQATKTTLRRQLALQALSESQLAELEYREEKASHARTMEIYSDVPEGQEIEEDGQTFIAESKARLEEKKARYHELRRSGKTPKQVLDVSNFVAVESTENKGLNVKDPSAKRSTNTPVHSEEHTRDPTNPLQTSFRNGYVIGYPEHIINEIIEFKQTDWKCDNDEAEPTFAVGGGDVYKPPIVQGVEQLSKPVSPKSTAEAPESTTEADEEPTESDTIDLSTLNKEERWAYEQNLKATEKRVARAARARAITKLDKKPKVDHEIGGSFTSKLLQDTKYNGIELTPGIGPQTEERTVTADLNDEELRLQVKDTTALMDNHAYQPKQYQAALNSGRVASRKRPVIPGQNPNGNTNLWWQTTGANEIKVRRDDAVALRLKQLGEFRADDDPWAHKKCDMGVRRGIVLADEVGIGKTDTCALYRLMRLNDRKHDLQTMRDSGDTLGLRAYPKPRPGMAITQPHLVSQIARSFAKYSDLFHVYIYGGGSNDLPSGVSRITEKLTRDHPLFDQTNEHNSQVIIVTSYPTLSARHGPPANKKYMMEAKRLSMAKAENYKFRLMREPGNPDWRAPHDLDQLFDDLFLDEAQNSKGISSHSSYTVRLLNCEWNTLVTATPTPYSYRDFAGMLSFVQSPFDNDVARARIMINDRTLDFYDSVAEKGPLSNPYTMTDGKFDEPAEERYRYTTAAFEKYAVQQSLDAAAAGQILATLFKRFMIRRDYASQCVVDSVGTVHTIGSSMAAVHRFTVHADNAPLWQQFHDSLIAEHTGQVIVDEDSQSAYLNGRSARIMNLAAISPMLLSAKEVHIAKVKAERDSVKAPLRGIQADTIMEEGSGSESPSDRTSGRRDRRLRDPPQDFDDESEEESDSEADSEDETELLRKVGQKTKDLKVESPHLALYRDLFMKEEYETWFRKLMEDIYGDIQTKDRSVSDGLFSSKTVAEISVIRLVSIFLRSSARLLIMVTQLVDQVDSRNEKALIFAQSPWEQQLYTVILCLLGYKTKAILSTMKGQLKDDIIGSFQSPLARWNQPGFTGVKQSDLEILVLSYHMNSGLNLHSTCHNIHAPSPPPSFSIWVQSCGRVARFGQPFACIVMLYIANRTYNIAQYGTLMVNALSTVAALTCEVQTDGNESGTSSRVNFDELSHFHGYKDTLIDDRSEGFAEVERTCPDNIDRHLDLNDKFVRILSVLLGTSIMVDSASAGTYSITTTENLFKSYAPLETPRTPKKKDKKRKDVSGSVKQNKRKKNVIAKPVPPLPAPFNSSGTALSEDESKDEEEMFDLSELKLSGNFMKTKGKAKKKEADRGDGKEVLSDKPSLVAKLPLSKTKAKPKSTKSPMRKRPMLSEETVVDSEDEEPTPKKRHKPSEDSEEDYEPENENKSSTPPTGRGRGRGRGGGRGRAAKPKRKR